MLKKDLQTELLISVSELLMRLGEIRARLKIIHEDCAQIEISNNEKRWDIDHAEHPEFIKRLQKIWQALEWDISALISYIENINEK